MTGTGGMNRPSHLLLTNRRNAPLPIASRTATPRDRWPLDGFRHNRSIAGWNWWARQDSNLEPRDSLVPEVSLRSGLSLHPSPDAAMARGQVGCGTLEPVIKGALSPQVVSAPSAGAPAAWLRVATGRMRAAEVSLNSSRSRPRITPRRHLSMSPLL